MLMLILSPIELAVERREKERKESGLKSARDGEFGCSVSFKKVSKTVKVAKHENVRAEMKESENCCCCCCTSTAI